MGLGRAAASSSPLPVMGSVCEALARPDEGEALTGRDDHDLSRQPASSGLRSRQPIQSKPNLSQSLGLFYELVVIGHFSCLGKEAKRKISLFYTGLTVTAFVAGNM